MKNNVSYGGCGILSQKKMWECFMKKAIFFEIQELNCTQFRNPFRGGLFVNLHKKLSKNHQGGINKGWWMVKPKSLSEGLPKKLFFQ